MRWGGGIPIKANALSDRALSQPHGRWLLCRIYVCHPSQANSEMGEKSQEEQVFSFYLQCEDLNVLRGIAKATMLKTLFQGNRHPFQLFPQELQWKCHCCTKDNLLEHLLEPPSGLLLALYALQRNCQGRSLTLQYFCACLEPLHHTVRSTIGLRTFNYVVFFPWFICMY